MRLICPSCGAIASAEAWQNEATVRQFMGVLENLPNIVRERALPYLGLFRSGAKKGLAWPRALRVLSDLAALVGTGTVHWDGGETRPCPPGLWAEAVDAVLARRPRDLENHNYLRKVAWDKAGPLAAQAERSKDYESSRREHANEGAGGEEAPMSPEELRAWAHKLGEAMAGGMGSKASSCRGAGAQRKTGKNSQIE